MTIIYNINVKLTHDGELAYFINPTILYSDPVNSIFTVDTPSILFAAHAVNAVTTVGNAARTPRHNVI
jgi:hypothetical protein